MTSNRCHGARFWCSGFKACLPLSSRFAQHLGGISTLSRTAPFVSVTRIYWILAVQPHVRHPGFWLPSSRPQVVSTSQSRSLAHSRYEMTIGCSALHSCAPSALTEVPHTQPTKTQMYRTWPLILHFRISRRSKSWFSHFRVARRIKKAPHRYPVRPLRALTRLRGCGSAKSLSCTHTSHSLGLIKLFSLQGHAGAHVLSHHDHSPSCNSPLWLAGRCILAQATIHAVRCSDLYQRAVLDALQPYSQHRLETFGLYTWVPSRFPVH